MIVQRAVLETYIDFIEKALGSRRGYTQSQRQELLAEFAIRQISDLDRLIYYLRNLLIEGLVADDFPIEDTQSLLLATSEEINNRQLQKTHQKLRDDLLIIPDSLKEEVFALTDIMAKFKDKYPQKVNFEDLGWSLKRLIQNIFSR